MTACRPSSAFPNEARAAIAATRGEEEATMIVTLVKRVSRVLLATHGGGGSQPKCDVYVEIGPDLGAPG